MMDIFEYDSYKPAIRAFVSSLPRKGRGELGRIARVLRIHPTLVSQMLNGEKHLTLEQACVLAEYIGLSDPQTDYFLGLVEFERAGSEKLRRRIKLRLTALRSARLEIKNRLPKSPAPLTEAEQAIFYSDWYYSAARLLSSIPAFNDTDVIAQRLGLPRLTVTKAVNFLLETGLCVKHRGSLEMGPQRTHVAKDSHFFKSHQRNWRLRAMQKLDLAEQDDLFFTSPLTVSKADADRIRSIILKLITEVATIVDPSQPEELLCLNVEFFKV